MTTSLYHSVSYLFFQPPPSPPFFFFFFFASDVLTTICHLAIVNVCVSKNNIRLIKIIIIIIIIITMIIIIMYSYHALINALSAHMIHINLNMIFYIHVEHSPTKTIYIIIK